MDRWKIFVVVVLAALWLMTLETWRAKDRYRLVDGESVALVGYVLDTQTGRILAVRPD